MKPLRFDTNAKLHQKFLPRREQAAWLWHQGAQFVPKATHAYQITLKISKKLWDGESSFDPFGKARHSRRKRANEFWKLIRRFIHSNVLMKSERADHSIRVSDSRWIMERALSGRPVNSNRRHDILTIK